ncbi:MAG: hypothetical protein JWP87_2587 [Labilithrix sp.]|jgi:hypothetical protein|nr:hypothetical protein [Labilithrix sp.]
MNAFRWLFFPLLLVSMVVLVGCPSKEATEAKSPAGEPGMDDALSLLPGNAIAAGTVDARAFFSSQTFGADLAKIVEKYVPIGAEAGFQASRDVDRVTFASYSYQGIDVAAIVIGRFDSAKIKQVAAAQTPTKNGGTLVASQYAGRDVYTVNNIGFTLLSDTRAIVGTEQGIRRVLERINDKRVKRDIAAWMITTIEAPGAAFAVAGDFASQPIPAEATRQIPGPLVVNLKAMRAFATFKDGVQIAGSITYADATSAESASGAIKQAMGYAKLLAALGIKLQNVDVKVEKSDVQVSLAVDDQSLRALLAYVPSLMGQ